VDVKRSVVLVTVLGILAGLLLSNIYDTSACATNTTAPYSEATNTVSETGNPGTAIAVAAMRCTSDN
jgi:hypothetical protein